MLENAKERVEFLRRGFSEVEIEKIYILKNNYKNIRNNLLFNNE